MPSAAQPTVGQNGVARSPKCSGRGRPANDANSTAVPMKIIPWRNVAITVNVASSALAFVAASRIPTTTTVAIRATTKPTPAYHAGLGARDGERPLEHARLRLRHAHLRRSHDAVHKLHDSGGPEPVGQRTVPVARDDQRHAALAQLAESRQHIGIRAELKSAEHRPPRGGVIEAGHVQRAPHLLGAAVAEALEALRIRALEMVVEVVRDLRHEPRAGLLLAHSEARLAQEPRQPRRRRLQPHERAERVEQDCPNPRHAIQCQLAYWAVKRPRPTANPPATRSVERRSWHTTASHMKIGNSTATKRGSDISGWGATGNERGSTSEAANHVP